MSLATTVLYPTTFLYNQYVTLLEHERGAAIGEDLQAPPAAPRDDKGTPPQTPSQPLQLAVRVTSLAHAAIQFVVAALETVPLLVATTVTILVNSYHNRFARIFDAAGAALHAAWVPVATSIYTSIYPDDLSSRTSVANGQNALYARLFAYSLPSLSKIADQLPPEKRVDLNRYLSEFFPVPKGLTEETFDRLRQADIEDIDLVGWRTPLAQGLTQDLTYNPSPICRDIDLSSDAFVRRLAMAVINASSRR